MSELQQRLNELFEYRDGELFWKVDRGSQKCKGQKVGSLNGKGYMQVRVREIGSAMLLHRVVWIMHHGEAPECLDHINGDKSDNRIENLRPASRSENAYNRPAPSNNVSGVKNVSWYPRNKKWGVSVSIGGVKKFFGLYADLELADLIAQEVRHKFHGEFAAQ